MGTTTTVTGNVGTRIFNLARVDLCNMNSKNYSYTNGTGDDIELLAGRIFGVTGLTNAVLPQNSASTDGTQIPFGVLLTDLEGITVADGATVTITLMIKGEVNEDLLIYADGDSKDTPINNYCDGDPVPMGTIDSIFAKNGIILRKVQSNCVAI